MEKYLNLIENMPLFNGINKSDIGLILSKISARVMVFNKNEVIFAEGEKALEAGVILLGKAQIIKEDYKGNRNIISWIEKGQMFGEALCCTETDILPVGIYSVEKTAVLLFDLKPIMNNNIIESYTAQFLKNLLEIIASKTLNLRAKINIISRRTTREKIMAYLLSESKRVGKDEFTIPFDRQGLADFLGVERSAMSFEISKLCKEKLIETNKSYFKILR